MSIETYDDLALNILCKQFHAYVHENLDWKIKTNFKCSFAGNTPIDVDTKIFSLKHRNDEYWRSGLLFSFISDRNRIAIDVLHTTIGGAVYKPIRDDLDRVLLSFCKQLGVDVESRATRYYIPYSLIKITKEEVMKDASIITDLI
jgi:hypothetical protein